MEGKLVGTLVGHDLDDFFEAGFIFHSDWAKEFARAGQSCAPHFWLLTRSRIVPLVPEAKELFQHHRDKQRPHHSTSRLSARLTSLLPTMISRSALGRNAQHALRRQCCAQPANRRGFAAAASGSTSFSYETSEVDSVKVASRDVAGPTTRLAVVAKAGTRYQPAPGLTTGLEYFAFKVLPFLIEFNSCPEHCHLTALELEH